MVAWEGLFAEWSNFFTISLISRSKLFQSYNDEAAVDRFESAKKTSQATVPLMSTCCKCSALSFKAYITHRKKTT